jgi:hypothetical protein
MPSFDDFLGDESTTGGGVRVATIHHPYKTNTRQEFNRCYNCAIEIGANAIKETKSSNIVRYNLNRLGIVKT